MSRRKKVAWEEAEIAALRTAVEQFGQGRWKKMLEADREGPNAFHENRTPDSLKDRWALQVGKDEQAKEQAAELEALEERLAAERKVQENSKALQVRKAIVEASEAKLKEVEEWEAALQAARKEIERTKSDDELLHEARKAYEDTRKRKLEEWEQEMNDVRMLAQEAREERKRCDEESNVEVLQGAQASSETSRKRKREEEDKEKKQHLLNQFEAMDVATLHGLMSHHFELQAAARHQFFFPEYKSQCAAMAHARKFRGR